MENEPVKMLAKFQAYRLGLRLTLVVAFGVIVLGGGALSVVLGYRVTSEAIVAETQRRVETDLRGAWARYQSELDRVRTVVRLTSLIQKTHDVLSGSAFDPDLARSRLEMIRKQQRLDALTLVDPTGRVVMRTRYPYNAGDMAYMDPAIGQALETHASVAGTVVWPQETLRREGQDLAEKAFIEVQPTPMAGPSPKEAETSGMMLEAVEPVRDENDRLIGYVYGAVLLNRNYDLVDSIRETVFRSEVYEGRPVGTATLFLGDVRIATNVVTEEGNRAVGTRLSKAVRDSVLENGRSFYDRAFVVNDWYVTAYDPIRSPDGQVVGILYVGLLEKKFLTYRNLLTQGFLVLSAVCTGLVLLFSMVFAAWLYRPIRRLTRAAGEMASGRDVRVPAEASRFRELHTLGVVFNQMAEAVAARTKELQAANAALKETNEELSRINRNYMEMLGFVSHEMKSPLASSIFAVASMREGYFGPLRPDQMETLASVERNLEHLNEMILRYLTLSRIEQGDLQFRPRRIGFRKAVAEPSMEQVSSQAEAAGMKVRCEVPEDLTLDADPDLLRTVFDNLLSNAVKYGRPGTEVVISCGRRPDGWHSFRVTNVGQIPEDQLGRLFQKFTRLDTEETTRKRGTGLGLYITKKLVELHGGTIHAESGGGLVTFVVALPQAMPGRDITGPGQT